MPKICYKHTTVRSEGLRLINLCNDIITTYKAQGYELTLRQVYYQMVSRGYILNNDKSYKTLGNLLNTARLSGLVDWNAIEDRTRNMKSNAHWKSPGEIVAACAAQFQFDKWKDQPYHVTCLVEKDALVGVIEAAAAPLDISFLSCRGYMSQSEMWVMAQSLMKKAATGKKCLILHLGDHDPSGVDMSRDITERIRMFWDHHYEEGTCRVDPYDHFEVNRLALNWDQVQQYNPPPNPTKLTDTRSTDYIERYGHECWELDALEPSVIRQLIEDAVLEVRDQALWDAAVAREKEARGTLRKISTDWDKVTKLFGGTVTEAFKAPEEDWVVFKVRFDDENADAEDHYRDCCNHLEEALEMGLGLDTDEYHIEWYAVGEFEVTIKREVNTSEVYDMLTDSLEGQEHEIEITGLEM